MPWAGAGAQTIEHHTLAILSLLLFFLLLLLLLLLQMHFSFISKAQFRRAVLCIIELIHGKDIYAYGGKTP